MSFIGHCFQSKQIQVNFCPPFRCLNSLILLVRLPFVSVFIRVLRFQFEQMKYFFRAFDVRQTLREFRKMRRSEGKTKKKKQFNY